MRPKCRKVTFPLICLLSECSLPSSKISSKVNDTLQLYSALLKTIKRSCVSDRDAAPFFNSKLPKPFPHLIVCEFSALRLLQDLHRLCNGGVPLIRTDLPANLSLLQPIIGTVIFHTGRTAVRLALRFLAVRPYFPAGPLRLTRRNIAAVAGVVAGSQQKMLSAVMTPPRCVPDRQPAVELRSQKIM